MIVPAERRLTRWRHVSLRIYPPLLAEMEALAVDEQMSVNAVFNALCDVALARTATEEGWQEVHAACVKWRTKRQYVFTAQWRERRPPEEERPG
jgi:hypothetical protein